MKVEVTLLGSPCGRQIVRCCGNIAAPEYHSRRARSRTFPTLLQRGSHYGFAACLDDARANKPARTTELGVAHALGVVLNVIVFFAEFSTQLRVRGMDRTERGHQFFDPSLIQHLLVNHHPVFLLGPLVRVQFAGQFPQVLAGVKQIENLNGAVEPEAFCGARSWVAGGDRESEGTGVDPAPCLVTYFGVM